jgi:pantetheine-phosphate adenylyltransferase
MKVGVYAGSFNPWHEGHTDVLNKALKVFDKVIVLFAKNETKRSSQIKVNVELYKEYVKNKNIVIESLEEGKLLLDFCKEKEVTGIIRGLRDEKDLQYEKNMLYWNEDLGSTIPTVFFICDRNLVHISSSAIRSINGIK